MRQDVRHAAVSGDGLMSAPGHVRSPTSGLRIAVISSSLDPSYNALWEATRPQLSHLWVVGAVDASRDALGSASIPLREIGMRKGLVWRHLVGLRPLLRHLRPDLIHVNAELWSVTAQETIGCSVPVVVHGAENIWDHGSRAEQSIRRQLVNRAVRKIHGYASWNEQGTDYIRTLSQRRHGQALPTLVLPAVVPPPDFRSISWNPPTLVDGGTLEIVLVGRLVASKGFEGAIRAAEGLGRKVRVSVCGTGSEAPRLREVAEEAGLEYCELGRLSPSALASRMAGAHVMLQPSLTTPEWSEQFGRSVAEAMTVGLPCLVSDSGELPNVVGNDPRAIFREGDVDDMTRVLQDVSSDIDRLRSLSTHQQAVARKWDPDVAAAAMLDFWTACLS